METTVHPHLIIENDVLECNGVILEQFETSLDDHESLMEILDESNLMCSVHKTFIPIAKFRNAIIDEDKVEFLTTRHHGRNNYAQAESVYLSQCRKSDLVRNANNYEDNKEQDRSSYGIHGEMRTVDCNVEPDEVHGDELDDEHEDEEGSTIPLCVLAAKGGRGVAELPVNPVFLDWRRSVRRNGYMQTWKKNLPYRNNLKN